MLDRSSLGFIVLAIALVMGVYVAREQSHGQPAPNFSLPNGYGGRLDLESYRGRPVLLVFWATWCGICQREMPELNRLEPEFESKGISVVAIHLGSQDDADAYTRANHIYFTSVADPEGKVGQAYHVGGVPTLVLIGADGRVKRSVAGWTGESVLREWMDTVEKS